MDHRRDLIRKSGAYAERTSPEVLFAFRRNTKGAVEHFQAKWTPVRVKKMRQYKGLEPRSDSIGTEKALAPTPLGWDHPIDKNTRLFNKMEHVLIGKVEPLFRHMLLPEAPAPRRNDR